MTDPSTEVVPEVPLQRAIDDGAGVQDVWPAGAPLPLASAVDAGDQDAPLAGLLGGKPGLRKKVYYSYASAALVVSFGPDIVIADVLAAGDVPHVVAAITIASSILLKIGVAFGFVAASNVK